MFRSTSLCLSDDESYASPTDSSYMAFCLKMANNIFGSYPSMEAIGQNEDRINAYANIDYLEAPKDIPTLQEEMAFLSIRKIRAVKCVLEGRFFTEHQAAGEATRLGLGTKYLINVKNDLSLETISKRMSTALGRDVTEKEIVGKAECSPQELLSLSLGERHMLQLSFDIYNLAREFHTNPLAALEKQKMLVVLNAKHAEPVIREWMKHRYYGFSRENVMFIIQKAYPGIHFCNNDAFFEESSPRRLHNHGYIALQQTMDHQIFYMDEYNRRCYIRPHEYGALLDMMDVKVNLSIESLSLLTESIDFETLGFAIEEGEKGVRMLMEIVRNDPENPQKGGMAAYDSKLGKNVMIEAFQLMGIPNEQVTFLNKNWNHYPKPNESWSVVRQFGLNMPISVKQGFLYFQPVQGDINFMLNTTFFQRESVKPIKAWKSIVNTPQVIRAMRLQDQQEGFQEYAESFLGKRI